MRCPDCNGDIEGDAPLCPHCGRALGGALLRRLPFSRSRDPKAGNRTPEWPGHSVRTPGDRPFPMTDALAALRARIAPLAPYLPSLWGACAGGLLGAMLPGGSWLAGAFIGFMVGQSYTKKKKS